MPATRTMWSCASRCGGSWRPPPSIIIDPSSWMMTQHQRTMARRYRRGQGPSIPWTSCTPYGQACRHTQEGRRAIDHHHSFIRPELARCCSAASPKPWNASQSPTSTIARPLPSPGESAVILIRGERKPPPYVKKHDLDTIRASLGERSSHGELSRALQVAVESLLRPACRRRWRTDTEACMRLAVEVLSVDGIPPQGRTRPFDHFF